MEEIQFTTKSIADYGMMAVTAACFLVLSVTMLTVFVRWFVKIINGIIATQKETLSGLLEETRQQNEKLEDIREGLAEENLMQIKALSSFAFDLATEQVCRLVKKVREENNLADRPGTQEKIKRLLQNAHEGRNSRFDNFRFRGRRLSQYTSGAWVAEVAEVVVREVYSPANNGRTYTNVSAAYDNIKLEFYHNLKSV